MKRVTDWSLPVTMVWRDPDNRAIVLTQQFASGVGPIQVGKESVQEVKINGQPAALIGGMWDGASGTWSYANMLTLMWRDERVAYELNSSSSIVSVTDLIRMAELLQLVCRGRFGRTHNHIGHLWLCAHLTAYHEMSASTFPRHLGSLLELNHAGHKRTSIRSYPQIFQSHLT